MWAGVLNDEGENMLLNVACGNGIIKEFIWLFTHNNNQWVFNCKVNRKRRKRGRQRKNVDGRCTSSHENKTFRSRSVVKQKGVVFGFRKTATAVTRPER